MKKRKNKKKRKITVYPTFTKYETGDSVKVRGIGGIFKF